MERQQVADIAQGRVWSGIDARRLGLVDELGGLDQAIESAAALAGLDQYDTKTVKQPLSPQEQLVNQLLGGGAMSYWLDDAARHSVMSQLGRWLAPFREQLDYLGQMNDPRGMYLHCTVCVAP